MGKVFVCFDVSCHCSPENQENFENLYVSSYKKLSSFLYSHPKFMFSFYFSGLFFEWLQKKHEEFLTLLSELTNKKQIELFGGGYYDPLFPLIPPVDRIGQIEKLTTEIRKTTGKKPRGLKLVQSVWDSSIISSLKSCGIEYVMLDSNLITQYSTQNINFPFIVEDLGKTMTILPQFKSNIPDSQLIPNDFIKKINLLSKNNLNSIVCITFEPSQIEYLLKNNWFEDFYNLSLDLDWLEISTPQIYLKNMSLRNRVNISPTASSDLLSWAYNPYEKSKKLQKNENIRSFFYTYPETYLLYTRMMYTCMINDQCRGDKIRKKYARQNIWQAQNYVPYIFDGKDGVSSSKYRDYVYKNLIASEKTSREVQKNIQICNSIDLDMDGILEYIFKFLQYNAFVSTIGGMLLELDVFSNLRNYVNTMSRIKKLDGIDDIYLKKMFVDHFIEKEEFEAFTKDVANVQVVFGNLYYSVQSFDRVRKELLLNAHGVFGSLQQDVYLRKKYIFSENGIQVQYIIKNASPLPLKGVFAVESNISFVGNTSKEQFIEVITEDTKEISCPDQIFIRQNDVSFARFTDKIGDVSFNFQPNENSGLCIQQLNLCRSLQEPNQKQYCATTLSFFWDIDIAPGLELEKTLYMSILTKQESTKSKRCKSSLE